MKCFKALFFIIIIGFFMGCDQTLEDIIGNVADGIELTEEQEIDLVAMGVSDASGGVMNLFRLSGDAVLSSFYSGLGKLDTTISYDWVQLTLGFSFYSGNTEVPFFMPGLVDSITCAAAFSGTNSFPSPADETATWGIDLNSDWMVYLKHFVVDSVRVHGSGLDSSKYVYTKNGITLQVDSYSTFDIRRVAIPLSGNTHIPVSGQISGAAVGTAYTENLSKDFNIPYVAQFTSNREVLVTLTNSGRQFTVNLVTGKVTKK